jgi:TPR repeat protein
MNPVMRATLPLAICVCVSLASARAGDSEDPTKDIFDKGVALYDAGKFEEAYKIFVSIDDENVAAMYNVAYMKRKGQGTAKDPRGAEDMYRLSAMAGDPRSQADLGEMLMVGEAGQPDMDEAAKWLTLAAAARHPVAEFELGELYEAGHGVQKDLEAARELYQDAAARGVPGAKDHLAALPAKPVKPSHP